MKSISSLENQGLQEEYLRVLSQKCGVLRLESDRLSKPQDANQLLIKQYAGCDD